jgi:hypothetical protein
MKSIFKIHFLFLIVALLIVSNVSSLCKSKHENKIEKSFYYWKTKYDFDKKDIEYADTIGLQHLYIKCFDIDWSPNAAKPIPVGIIDSYYGMPMTFESVTPCVFITNTVMEKCTNDELLELAEKISEKLNKISGDFAKSYSASKAQPMYDSVYALNNKPDQKLRNELLNRIDRSRKSMEQEWFATSCEIQIDCDWTAKTKEKYFYFLEKIKSLNPEKAISCTLRLWQYANTAKAGIPPVDRCMLMCYSVGSPKIYDGKNSISNAEDIKSYLKKDSYSLPLDIALPVFSWGVLFRNGHFKGILHDADIAQIQKDTLNFKQIDGNLYKYLTDTVIENTYIRYGDEVKFEQTDTTELSKIIDLVKTSISLQDGARIAFFSWDTTYIKQYGLKNFEKYYKSFE